MKWWQNNVKWQDPMARNAVYLEGGDDETRIFDYKDVDGNPINITGYTATLTATVGTATPVVLTSSPSAGLTISGSQGRVIAAFTDTQTTALKAGGLIGYYKLKISNAGNPDETVSEGALVML